MPIRGQEPAAHQAEKGARYRILGPLEILDEGDRPVSLSRREAAVVGVLLLDANRVVSRDRLIEVVWGDRPPDTAVNALQVHISKLRKLLGGMAGSEGPLRTQAPGYRFSTSPGQLDAERFEHLVASSEADEGPDGVAARLTEALRLWRGPVLDGLEIGPLIRPEISRLEELRFAALERRIEADLALGRHRECIGELEALVQANPLREEIRRLLMLGLYRSGRQADALAVYRQTREILAGELGLDPGPALQATELAILNQDPGLDLVPSDTVSLSTPQAAVALASPAVSIPLPAYLEIRPTVGLIGRSHELGVIADAYQRAAKGSGREVLLVAGEAGLGKSALVAEAARAAFEDGACVLFGHCEEDLATPYQLFSEALGHFAAHASYEQLMAHLAGGSAELVRLIPSLTVRIPDLEPSRAMDADSERFLLFSAVVQVLASLSSTSPVVLVLDDLQWADRASLLLLRHLAGSDLPLNLLIVGTYRDSELTRRDALVETLGALHRRADVTRVELKGLDDVHVVALMEAAAGHDLDKPAVELAHAVFRETDGNPFFVSQVVRHLVETGTIYRGDGGRWTAHSDRGIDVLPDSVRDVIGARVVRLGKETGRTLELASVIGRDFDLDLLARVTARSEEELLDQLDAAAEAALVRDIAHTGGRFSFTHALIQRTLYEEMRPTRRANAHRGVAEALEDLCGTKPGLRVGELAHHWCQATQPVDLHKAIDFSRQAGDAALSGLAPDDAVTYYSQAVELCERSPGIDAELELDLAIGLGTAQRQAGHAAFRTTLLTAAHRASEVGDGARLVAAALANDRGTFSTVDSVDDEKVQVLEQALAQVGLVASDRAQLLAILCSESTVGTSLEDRMDLAEEAIAVARSTDDDATIVRVLNHVLLPLAVPPLIERVVEWSVEALDRAARLDDPLLLCAAASGRRYTAACAGDVEEMDRCFAVKEPLVAQLDQPFLLWVDTLQRGTRALIAGDTEEAERLAGEALKIGADGGEPDAPVAFGMQMLMVSLWRGTMGELVPLIEQAIKENPGLSVFRAALALAHSEAGRSDQAQHELQTFADHGFELPMDLTWLTGMSAYAIATIESSLVDFARPLLEALAPYAEQWHYSDVAAAGPVSRTLGGLATLLGRFDEADRYLAMSATSSKVARSPFFTAWSDLYRGRMLVARNAPGDAVEARSLLATVQATGAACRYGNVERRATIALARA